MNEKQSKSTHNGAAKSGRMIRAARGLLDWNQQDLAQKANVGLSTVRRIENGTGPVGLATNYFAVRKACEDENIRFIDESDQPGVIAGVLLIDPDLRSDS
tara:strand:- start:16388 stop:16687 length:300 start_codon:yes stop_codon:yes gene_type:complete